MCEEIYLHPGTCIPTLYNIKLHLQAIYLGNISTSPKSGVSDSKVKGLGFLSLEGTVYCDNAVMYDAILTQQMHIISHLCHWAASVYILVHITRFDRLWREQWRSQKWPMHVTCNR